MSIFDFSEVELKDLVVHKVGNRAENEGIVIADEPTHLDDVDVEELLLKYFLTPFKNQATIYKFFHESDLHLNEIYQYVSNIFLDRSQFYSESIKILKHLYEKSNHPRIKSGEFYLVYLKNCSLEDQLTDAIGIFKSENKDVYLKVKEEKREFSLQVERGINVKKLDKGCLIFNLYSAGGYKVSIVDAVNKGEEALYWKDEFLKLTDLEDNNFHTRSYLNLCKDYCEEIYANLHQADKTEQASFLNKTLNFFSENNSFDLEQFAEQVIAEPEQIASFRGYKEDYETANDFKMDESFDISPTAFKSIKKKFKNLIKLDTEVEIKIKNPSMQEDNTQFIERGYDEAKEMHYYKIFFNEEE